MSSKTTLSEKHTTTGATHEDGDLHVLAASASRDDLKLAKDGKTVLIPQPSDSPDDPLNWSITRKHLVLVPLMLASLLTDFGISWGSVLFEQQAVTFHMSVPDVANSISGGIFLQGAAGILAVPLMQRYGRLPILFWTQLLTALVVMAAALSPNYACFTAFRTLQGFFNTAPQVVGLAIVHDLFFFHERTRKVNLWVWAFLGGPFLGPFLAGWLVTAVSWRANLGVLAGCHGLALLLVVVLGKETLYDRIAASTPRPNRLAALTGILTHRTKGRPNMLASWRDLFIVQCQPQIFFLSTTYILVLGAWLIGINVTVTQLIVPPPYSFSDSGIACSWIASIIGAFLGGVWGHWFNDWLCERYIRKHKGVYVLENRLWGAYPPTLIGFAGLVLYGQALQHALHWIALLIGWGCVAFALVASTTSISAYCLDAFPKQASYVAAIINMWRTWGGFSVVYFQLKWIKTTGPGVSFGCQAMILGVAFLVGVVLTQVKGRQWRRRQPVLKAENEERDG